MPDQVTHRALMDEARATILSTASPTWKLILLFYEALHTVEEAILAPRNIQTVSHRDRERQLWLLSQMPSLVWVLAVHGDLLDMKSISVQARYYEHPSVWTHDDLANQEAALERIQTAIGEHCP